MGKSGSEGVVLNALVTCRAAFLCMLSIFRIATPIPLAVFVPSLLAGWVHQTSAAYSMLSAVTL